MPKRKRLRTKILKAISSPIRLQILNFLFEEDLLSYTELIGLLKMNPRKDAGKFAYHLKFLLNTSLVEANVKNKKYCLTDLGKMIINVADEIGKKTSESNQKLVRTSRYTLEDFEVNKITDSLTNESKISPELAQKIAKEAEKKLLKSKTKYLTAPLIREVVNSILIEKGYEEHRHNLTRLGLPVHDVTSLIEAKSKSFKGAESIIQTAGNSVLNEYMLLKKLPREISDAHLSGLIHIHKLSFWILKPNQINHDLRFFLKKNLQLIKDNKTQYVYPKPLNFSSFLSTIFNILLHSSKEISGGQMLDYFNVFISPFIKNLDPSTVKNSLRIFILNLNQNICCSLGLELSMPSFLKNKPAIGPSGKIVGKYEDYTVEAQLITSIIIEILTEEAFYRPWFYPKIILKIRSGTFEDEKSKSTIIKSLEISAKMGLIYFANLQNKKYTSIFSTTGFTLNFDNFKNLEIETMRTGILGLVSINLPGISYESKGNTTKFFDLLDERIELAIKALTIKNKELKSFSKGLFPFLIQDVKGEPYFNIEQSKCLINLVGFKETLENLFEEKGYETKEFENFIEEMKNKLRNYEEKKGKTIKKRLFITMIPDFEASTRLAYLDMEKYGVAKIKYSGKKEKPYYTTIDTLSLKLDLRTLKSQILKREKSRIVISNNLLLIKFKKVKHSENLYSLIQSIIKDLDLGFFKFYQKYRYCFKCQNILLNSFSKCPVCETLNLPTFGGIVP